MKYVAIVLAAGMGKRMDMVQNKQFLMLKDKPLIIHTLTVFEKDPWCDSIVLVIQPTEQERIVALLSNYSFATPIKLIEGGKERQDSAFLGLRALQISDKLVFIHDGARPFVAQKDLHKLARVANEHHAALLAVPVTDTIKQRNGKRLKTLDRERLWAAQTPQAFQYDLIWRAHQVARQSSYVCTDDASLVERLGHPVEIVEGNYKNIKLTTPEDIKKALFFLENE
ncbi:2-C-methyl-D-erythritol 4-phosphate cytidylyltransferase [Paraliobacillus quinghaiensis]|uniref:2-C-methyl-D-erythritol 4-phosphate cytidylyltransferase n=1 Tax=Paraliobacillus quinghaiensis TaxID=470815 RepID=UPI000E3E08A7|nr:2-C-methyl-D-erythritol 4-phosphate cytidylyltransferase [Paraliobacillus quinghaiensis]